MVITAEIVVALTPNYVRQFMKILDQVTVFNFMVV